MDGLDDGRVGGELRKFTGIAHDGRREWRRVDVAVDEQLAALGDRRRFRRGDLFVGQSGNGVEELRQSRLGYVSVHRVVVLFGAQAATVAAFRSLRAHFGVSFKRFTPSLVHPGTKERKLA